MLSVLLNTCENFKNYAEYGIVPGREKNGHSVPQNSFYRSVNYIDGIVGPIKDAVFGVGVRGNYIGSRSEENAGTLTHITWIAAMAILKPLYLTFAYLSYLPAKLTSRKNTESLVDYSSTLLHNADKHSDTVAELVKTVLSYICAAVIWTAALIVTPIVFITEKAHGAVKSKLSEVKSAEQYTASNNEIDYEIDCSQQSKCNQLTWL